MQYNHFKTITILFKWVSSMDRKRLDREIHLRYMKRHCYQLIHRDNSDNELDS